MLVAGMFLAAVVSPVQSAVANEKTQTLLKVHNWKTSVALGNRYLKQQSLMATRDALARLGRERDLGKSWKPGNMYFDAAEKAVSARLLDSVQTEWTSGQWLAAEWDQIAESSFTEGEMNALLAHFATEVGQKQAKIIDHTVAFHVGGVYTMSGKLIQDYPGTAEEQKTLTYVWDEEERETRFSIAAHENVDGQRFALSPLGAKYQRTLIIKVTGVINARLDRVAAGLPEKATSNLALAEPFVTNYRADASK